MEHIFTDDNFEAEVLKSEKPVLIDFWAPWCGPCRTMSPIIEEIAGELGEKIKVGKMNVDENMDTPGKHGVMSIPTFIIFKDGQPIDRFVGSMPKEEVLKKVEAHL